MRERGPITYFRNFQSVKKDSKYCGLVNIMVGGAFCCPITQESVDIWSFQLQLCQYWRHSKLLSSLFGTSTVDHGFRGNLSH